MKILKAQATAARKRLVFYAKLASTGGPATGLTWATTDVFISIDEGTKANIVNVPVEWDATNFPGRHYITFDSTEIAAYGRINVRIKHASIIEQNHVVDVVAIDEVDIVRQGMTALPNAAAEAAGGLLTRGTSTGQIQVDGAGNVKADVNKWLAGTIPAVNVTGVPLVDAKYLLGTVFATPSTAGVPSVDAIKWQTGTIPAPNVTGVPLVDAKYLLGTVLATPAVAGIMRVEDAVTQARLTSARGGYLDALNIVGLAASRADVSNIAVTGAALNLVTSSRTITSGSGSGGATNTQQLDGTYDSLSDSAGALDFYYEFDLTGTTDAVGVGISWVGYAVGITNTINVYARNWGGSSWDQIGTVVGIAGTANMSEEWELTSAHTSAGLVRLRFAATGLTSATLKTDRVLLGYTVMPGSATSMASVLARLPAALVSGRMDSSVGAMASNVLTYTAVANGALGVVRSGTAQAGAASTITLDSGATATDSFYRNTRIHIVAGTGIGQSRGYSSYVGSTKVYTVDLAWTTAPDNTSVFVLMSNVSGDVSALATAASLATAQTGITSILEASGIIRRNTATAGASTTITLDASASATNDFYNNATIVLLSGTGLLQFRNITDYVGSTKVATVDRAWTTNPDATSVFVILAAGGSVDNSAIAAAVWAAIGEGSDTYGDLIRLLCGVEAGAVGDFTTNTLVFLSDDGAKIRLTVTRDATGRLTSVRGDLT